METILLVAANLILLTISIICFATGETVQGCAFLAVMWVGSVVDRIQKSGGGNIND
ncbi:hypothetical protein IGI43_000788 [Enterococcus sp. AZ126]